MAKVDIDGTPFEYFKNGNGEPLVFVHGSASDYRTWQFQQNEFAKRFSVIVYSRRYHWPNEPIADDVDYSMISYRGPTSLIERSRRDADECASINRNHTRSCFALPDNVHGALRWPGRAGSQRGAERPG